MANYTKLYLEGHDLDEEFDPFEPIYPSGSCQGQEDEVYFDRTQDKDDEE